MIYYENNMVIATVHDKIQTTFPLKLESQF